MEHECCHDEERREGRETVNGFPILDLHRHKGLWRGIILEGDAYSTRQRVMFWGRNGRLSQRCENPYDVRVANR